MPVDDVALVVNGVRYSGWKSIRITQSIEGLTGSFALDVSDRWDGKTAPWPIAEGDECRVEIDGDAVITGYVDKRTLAATKDSRTLSYTGRDAAADLVDCSVVVPDASTKGHKWTYRNLDVAQFVTQIASPHGIKVSIQPGLTLKKDPLLVAHAGEKGFEAIQRAVGSTGVLVVSDGIGGILLTGPGTSRSDALLEGVNIKEASLDYNATERFHQYLISSQPPGTDDAYGDATRVEAQAIDVSVLRTNRVLLIRPDKGMDTATAKRRADWEARIRAAKATTAMVTVQGWKQSTGTLWKLNTLSHLSAPRMIGVDGDMLISQIEFSIGDGGRLTQLHLVRPDAFTPEPQTAVVGGEGLWNEITPGKKP